MKKLTLSALFACVGLVACGGDDGSVNPPTPPPPPPGASAEGAWEGNLSDKRSFSSLVLEDGTFYTLYGPVIGGALYVAGVIQGVGEYRGATFRTADAVDFPAGSSPAWTAVNATYEPGVSIQGSVIGAGRNITFNGSPISTAVYNYNTPANLASVSGNWVLSSAEGDAVHVSIAGSAIQATSGGCSFSGSVSPRSTGKNVFDVSVTFGGTPCRLPGQKMQGNAIALTTPSNQLQLIVIATNSSRTAAVTAFGAR